jgi:hypothetical protein
MKKSQILLCQCGITTPALPIFWKTLKIQKRSIFTKLHVTLDVTQTKYSFWCQIKPHWMGYPIEKRTSHYSGNLKSYGQMKVVKKFGTYGINEKHKNVIHRFVSIGLPGFPTQPSLLQQLIQQLIGS